VHKRNIFLLLLLLILSLQSREPLLCAVRDICILLQFCTLLWNRSQFFLRRRAQTQQLPEVSCSCGPVCC
jgi:hypothetical protein